METLLGLPPHLLELIFSKFIRAERTLRGRTLTDILPFVHVNETSTGIQQAVKGCLKDVRTLDVNYPAQFPAHPEVAVPFDASNVDLQFSSRIRTLIRLINGNLEHLSLPFLEEPDDMDECMRYVTKYCQQLRGIRFVDHNTVSYRVVCDIARYTPKLVALDIFDPSSNVLSAFACPKCAWSLQDLRLFGLRSRHLGSALKMLKVRGSTLTTLEVNTGQHEISKQEASTAQKAFLKWFLKNAAEFLPRLTHLSISAEKHVADNALLDGLFSSFLRKMSIDFVQDSEVLSFPRCEDVSNPKPDERKYFSEVYLTGALATRIDITPFMFSSMRTLRVGAVSNLSLSLLDPDFRSSVQRAIRLSAKSLTCVEAGQVLGAGPTSEALFDVCAFVLREAPSIETLVVPYLSLIYEGNLANKLQTLFENVQELTQLRFVWQALPMDPDSSSWAAIFIRNLPDLFAILEPYCPKLQGVHVEEGPFFPNAYGIIQQEEVLEALQSVRSFCERRKNVDLRSLELQLLACSRYFDEAS